MVYKGIYADMQKDSDGWRVCGRDESVCIAHKQKYSDYD